MPRKKHEVDDRDEDDDEDQDDEDEDEDDSAHAVRDYLMARIGAALASADATKSICTEILATCVNPDDDKKGKQRKELLADALEAVGAASRALEDAEGVMKDMGPDEFELGEPWETE